VFDQLDARSMGRRSQVRRLQVRPTADGVAWHRLTCDLPTCDL
jgi:hypothetical protein